MLIFEKVGYKLNYWFVCQIVGAMIRVVAITKEFGFPNSFCGTSWN